MADKKTHFQTKNLTVQEFKELAKAVKDVFFFSQFICVIHPILGKVPFKLYEYQKRVLWCFLTKRFNIILKFRQAGVTELIAMFCLWLTLYHPNKNVQIISIKDRVAKKVLRKIKFMYKNLPDHLKIPIINGRPGEMGTATDMEFSNGSIITSIPTTEDAGRSEAVSLLVIDEAAIIRWANQIWAAAFPTLSTGGSAIVNSTPYGIGNWYHKTWVDACSSPGRPEDFNAIKLTWDMHPERDIEWYNTMSSKLGPRRTAQEIDGDFLTSGNSVFDLTDIRAIEDSLIGLDVIETRLDGNLVYVENPKPNTKYYIGADIASGRARDFSAFSVMDREGNEVAYFKGKMPVDRFADLLISVAKRYNNAEIAPESNDIGLAVTKLIQKAGYKNLYYSVQLLRKKGSTQPEAKKEPGWYTTSKNRPLIIDELEIDIREGNNNIKDPFFVQEAYTFIYDESNKPIAMGKDKKSGSYDANDEDDNSYTDDAILAKAITNFIRKGKARNLVVAPK